MKYGFLILLVCISGCSDKLPNIVGADFKGSDFDVLGQIADSMDPDEGWIYWVEGRYRDQEIGEKLAIMGNCPTIMKINANEGVLSYELSESAMKRFSKTESDDCILKYANAIEARLSKKLNAEAKRLATYQKWEI